MDPMESERRIQEMLASDSPPTQSLGETTDYRQVVLAWARAHNLTFEEMVRQLETAGGPEAERMIDDVRRDPQIELIVREALKEPLSGDSPSVTNPDDGDELVDDSAD